ncbi:MAG: YnfA family protein [Desulfotomaculales bacterium]
MSAVLKALFLFFLAGLAEIGGGYLVWLWLREHKNILLGILGSVVLILYGIIPTYQQEANFGRIYAAYGGVFVIMSSLVSAAWKAPRSCFSAPSCYIF